MFNWNEFAAEVNRVTFPELREDLVKGLFVGAGGVAQNVDEVVRSMAEEGHESAKIVLPVRPGRGHDFLQDGGEILHYAAMVCNVMANLPDEGNLAKSEISEEADCANYNFTMADIMKQVAPMVCTPDEALAYALLFVSAVNQFAVHGLMFNRSRAFCFTTIQEQLVQCLSAFAGLGVYEEIETPTLEEMGANQLARVKSWPSR